MCIKFFLNGEVSWEIFFFFLDFFPGWILYPFVCKLGFLSPSTSHGGMCGGMCTQLHLYFPRGSSGMICQVHLCALEISSRLFLSSSTASETWSPLPSINRCCLSDLFFIPLFSVTSGYGSNTEDNSALVMCHLPLVFSPLNYKVHIFWLLFF